MKRDMRLGRFEVNEHDVREMKPHVKRVMREVIVISVQHSFVCGQMEYLALSDLFRPVAIGEMAPLYQFTVEDDGGVQAKEVAA
ncbi:MAG: hypothetical protein CMK92_02105 [Pseudomonas sp.]|nr:hypothetical protein [Pseudomonas sp.]